MKNTCFASILIVGILIFNIGCKKKKEENPTPKYTIGESHAGGIIFYINSSKEHGLVCAPEDQSSALPWSNGTDIITNATGSGIGDGQDNTNIIVSAQGNGSYAAQICDELNLNGYSDWYLPSKSECFQMYYTLKLQKNIGNFADTLYWSSTEASINNAYSQYSNDGYPPNGGYYKNTAHRVRAIRAF